MLELYLPILIFIVVAVAIGGGRGVRVGVEAVIKPHDPRSLRGGLRGATAAECLQHDGAEMP